MKQTNFLSPNRKELLGGAIYIFLELFVLPSVLGFANLYLPNPLSAAQLNMVFFVMNFGITCYIFRKFIKRTLTDARQHLGNIFLSSIRGLLLYWLGNVVVMMIVLRVNPDFTNVNDATIAEMAENVFLPMAVCSIFFVPITEEILFRGVLFAGFYNRSRVKAFFVSILVFSAIHIIGYLPEYSWDTLLLCFIQYIPAGIALGWAYAKSGNILSPILIHMTINTIGMYYMR